jgi:hypothetical protein
MENVSIAQERHAMRTQGVERVQESLRPVDHDLDSRAMYRDPDNNLGGLGDDFNLMEPAEAIQLARDRQAELRTPSGQVLGQASTSQAERHRRSVKMVIENNILPGIGQILIKPWNLHGITIKTLSQEQITEVEALATQAWKEIETGVRMYENMTVIAEEKEAIWENMVKTDKWSSNQGMLRDMDKYRTQINALMQGVFTT